MKRIFSGKLLGLALAMVALVALVAMAATATGAYFSDTHDGALAGDGGKVIVSTNATTLNWANMLPGEVYSQTVGYQNMGDVPQDVYVVFNNKTALSALNSLGTYGAARLTSTHGANFYSNNLNDHPVDQGDVCKKLPDMVLLASNIGPTASGSMTFQFQYASKTGTGTNGSDFAFNTFPVVKASNTGTGGYPTNDGALAGYDQYYVNTALDTIPGNDGSGTGLPFQIVATQHGILPGAVGADAGF